MQTMRLSSIDIVQQQRKFGKVILRRLLTIMNAMVRTLKPWQSQEVPTT
jgi:hypothetical protein